MPNFGYDRAGTRIQTLILSPALSRHSMRHYMREKEKMQFNVLWKRMPREDFGKLQLQSHGFLFVHFFRSPSIEGWEGEETICFMKICFLLVCLGAGGRGGFLFVCFHDSLFIEEINKIYQNTSNCGSVCFCLS